MTTCSIPWCDKTGLIRRGWCTKHYQRWLKYGNPLMAKFERGGDPVARFWGYVSKGTGCWEWRGKIDKSTGYGRFKMGGKSPTAHRLSYEWSVGPIPDGLVIDHLCRNRRCVNPAHLEPVTQQVNVLRGETIVAANAAKTECQNGHPLSGDNLAINVRGARVCRTCARASAARMRERASS